MSGTADPVAGSTRSPDAATSTRVVRAQKTAPTQTADGTSVVGDPPPTPPADVPVVTPPATSVTIDVPQPKVSTAKPEDPVEVVTTALASAVNALFHPSAGDAPTAPIGSPVMWTLAAAARRESLTSAPSLDKPADPVTNSLAAVAITQTPPLAWLQQLPIIGPVFVTPIVALIHQIPVVSDVLHPLIGYPVQLGLPAGTPLPRDVKVISFDGTEIYTHFMPALGLAPGKTAPPVLEGPGLGLSGAT